MLVGLVCIPPSEDTQVVQKNQQEKQRKALVCSLSLVLISLQVKLLRCDCWTLKIYVALLGKGLRVSLEL